MFIIPMINNRLLMKKKPYETPGTDLLVPLCSRPFCSSIPAVEDATLQDFNDLDTYVW